MQSVNAGAAARPVLAFATPTGAHTALGWAGKTADMLVSLPQGFDERAMTAMQLKGQIMRLLNLAFEEVKPGMSETEVSILTSQVWFQIVRVAGSTQWGHWFNTEIVRSQMLQIIKRNLFTFSTDKLRAT